MRVLQLLLLVLNVSVVLAQEVPKAIDISSQLGIDNIKKYAVNGGVFKSAQNGVLIDVAGEVELLLLTHDGLVKTQTIMIQGSAENTETASILVDNQPPKIHTQWHNVVEQDAAIKVGPNSVLQWWNDEPDQVQTTVLLNGEQVASPGDRISFDAASQQVTITSKDVFGNENSWTAEVLTDFKGPEIWWRLQEPAVFSNNTWYAGANADAQLMVKDEASVDQVLVNDQVSSIEQVVTDISNNTRIKARDQLGNETTAVIDWQQDNSAPQVYFNADALSEDNNIAVSVDEVFELSVQDVGLGLSNAEYFSRSRKWKPLPKKVRFLNRGYYDIRVRAADKAGNELKRTLKFMVRN